MIKIGVDADTGNVTGAVIIVDAADREAGEIQSDTEAEFGHAVLAVEDPERHATSGEPDHHEEAAKRGSEIADEAAAAGNSATATASDGDDQAETKSPQE